MKWYKSKAVLIIVIFLGLFMFVYGGYDDSPGAQGLGLIAVITGIVGWIIKKRNLINQTTNRRK